jgi:hypothetical protein
MRKLILSTIFIAGIGLSAYSITKAVASRPEAEKLAGNELLSPESEPFVLTLRQSRLHVEIMPEHRNSSLSMFDILGNKVFEMPANESVEYNVANLKSGLYFLILKGPKGNFTRKFLHKQEG